MKLLSCVFNIDTACVELKFDDGSMIAIDTIAVAYAELMLNGDPETYLKTVTECEPLDS